MQCNQNLQWWDGSQMLNSDCCTNLRCHFLVRLRSECQVQLYRGILSRDRQLTYFTALAAAHSVFTDNISLTLTQTGICVFMPSVCIATMYILREDGASTLQGKHCWSLWRYSVTTSTEKWSLLKSYSTGNDKCWLAKEGSFSLS